MAKSAIATTSTAKEKFKPTKAEIIRVQTTLAKFYKVPKPALIAPMKGERPRDPAFIRRRNAAIYAYRYGLKKTCDAIASEFKTTRTTVIRGINVVEGRVVGVGASSAEYLEDLRKINKKLPAKLKAVGTELV